MLNREKHQLIMGRLLRDISAGKSLAGALGLKGDTCAYLFYNLPRFSVDLDFDVLDVGQADTNLIFETIKKLAAKHGEIKDSTVKRYTLFFLISYGDADHNIKIELNIRQPLENLRDQFELKEYLGIPLLAAKKSYVFAGKLAALTGRRQTAMRDIYDIWYFANQNWDIDAELLDRLTQKNAKQHLEDCIKAVEQVKDNEILHGIGELLGPKDKAWVKKNLKTETIFLLKNYLSVLHS